MKNCNEKSYSNGGSVMVWGCMLTNGVGKLKFVATNIYLDILKSSLSEPQPPQPN